MGQEVPTAKAPVKLIKPLPGWHGTKITSHGKVAVYCEAKHTIYSLVFFETMTVAELKASLARTMHLSAWLQVRLYWGDRELEDSEKLNILTPDVLLRAEMNDSPQTLAVSTDLKRVSPHSPSSPKAKSVEICPQLRTDLSDLSVPDLELRARRRKGHRSVGSQL